MRLTLAERVCESFPVGRVCSLLGVSRSGLYARRCRLESARVREDRHLKQQILEIHVQTKRRYGTPRVEQELRASGTRTSRKRVARLRQELGIRTRYRRKYQRSKDSNRQLAVAPKPPAASLRVFAGESDLGRRHHLPALWGALPLLGHPARPLLSPSGGLARLVESR